MHRSSAVRQQRWSHSEVAAISDTVWAQCSWLKYAGSARTIPNTLAQEMQYAEHIGIPNGRSLPLLFGIYVRRTALGRYSPLRNRSQSRWIRGRSMSSAVRLSIPGVRLPLFRRISSQAWLSHSSVMIFSQSLGKRISRFATASLCKCSISLVTLITDSSVVQHIAARYSSPWNGWYINPFALCPALPDSLGGRDSTDYYGFAVPPQALVICPPIPYGKLVSVPALLA